MRLVSNCEQTMNLRISRRLITMEKIQPYRVSTEICFYLYLVVYLFMVFHHFICSKVLSKKMLSVLWTLLRQNGTPVNIMFMWIKVILNQDTFTGVEFSYFTIFDLKICFKICWKGKNYKSPTWVWTHEIMSMISMA